MRECCKGDHASQWENGKFDSLPRPNAKPLITDRHKSCTRDYVMDIYLHAKFSHDPSTGFFSPYARNCASKMFTRLFSGFFQRPTATAQAPEPIFPKNTSNDGRGSAQGCAFSGSENTNLHLGPNPHYSRKTPFWARFWRDKFFGRKPLYNGDAPCKLHLIIIIAP